jgi:hypothetical protein
MDMCSHFVDQIEADQEAEQKSISIKILKDMFPAQGGGVLFIRHPDDPHALPANHGNMSQIE